LAHYWDKPISRLIYFAAAAVLGEWMRFSKRFDLRLPAAFHRVLFVHIHLAAAGWAGNDDSCVHVSTFSATAFTSTHSGGRETAGLKRSGQRADRTASDCISTTSGTISQRFALRRGTIRHHYPPIGDDGVNG
jgi:hypothetical protein